MAYLPPGEDGKLLLQHALFFQQTLGMRIFTCSINEKPSLIKRILNSEKNRSVNHLTPEKLKEFTKNVVPAKALKHFSFRIRSGRRLSLLIRQSKRGGYEFLMVDKSNKEIIMGNLFCKKYGAKIIIVSALTLNLDIKKSLVYKNAEKIKSMLSKRGIECEVQIINAPDQEKHKVILNFIQEENPDMIIKRTNQESNLKNTRIGKFVSELVHSCKIPVFTVNSFIPAIPDNFVQRLSISPNH